ncbi:hypothetical protein GCM10009552_37770 [Rothia nasimurium]
MKKTKCSEEQIAFALRQVETGTSIAEVCRKMGICEATYFNWKKKYGGLGLPELRRLRQLEEENRKLKQLVADRSLDKAMLQDVLRKNSEAGAAQGARRHPSADLRGEHSPLVRGDAAVANRLVLPA